MLAFVTILVIVALGIAVICLYIVLDLVRDDLLEMTAERDQYQESVGEYAKVKAADKAALVKLHADLEEMGEAEIAATTECNQLRRKVESLQEQLRLANNEMSVSATNASRAQEAFRQLNASLTAGKSELQHAREMAGAHAGECKRLRDQLDDVRRCCEPACALIGDENESESI